jgi:hypothetical protein
MEGSSTSDGFFPTKKIINSSNFVIFKTTSNFNPLLNDFSHKFKCFMLLKRKMEDFGNFEVIKIEGFQKGAGILKMAGK